MATFKDIFKRSFIEGFSRYDMTPENIVIAFAITSIFSVYIFFAYRIATRRTFYSKAFNITVAAVNLIAAAIILAMQSNVVVSLGMVGALSIVRFRTAVKDPMDLTFLFWSIASGIICGAGQAEIAFALAFAMTVALVAFDRVPLAKAPKILMVSGCDKIEDGVLAAVRKHCKRFTVKSRSLADGRMDIVVEVRTRDDAELARDARSLDGVTQVSLLAHDGEVTY